MRPETGGSGTTDCVVNIGSESRKSAGQASADFHIRKLSGRS